MIINGGARSNWRFFAKHLMRADQNERIAVTEIRGLAADNVRDAFREMDALARGTRSKNFFYHANLNPRTGEHLTESQWEQAIDKLEHNLGLEGHSRFIVEHEKPDGRIHRHVVWSRIDPDSMTARSDSRNFSAHERTARELERLFGHEPVQGVHTDRRDAERPERRPAGWETFRGKRSGIDPDAVKATLTALWQRSDTGSAFRMALDEAGYVLCRGDRRDFVLVDPAGDDHSLARRVEGAKAADIRARMADVDPNGVPTVAEGRLLARTAVSSAGGTGTIEEKATPLALPAGLADERVRREERLAGDVPTHMQEEAAGRRTRWPDEVPCQPGTAQRRSPWDTSWRRYADRAVLYAEASGPWRTDSDNAAGLDNLSHRTPSGPAGATVVSRRYTGSWAAFIQNGSVAVPDRAAGTSWQECIRQRAATSVAAGGMGSVLNAPDKKEAFSK